MVDYSGLENRRTERYRGFESLSLRKKGVNQVITRFTPFFTHFREIIILMLINNFIADEKKKNIRG